MLWTAAAVVFAVWATTILIAAAASSSQRRLHGQLAGKLMQLSSGSRKSGVSSYLGTRDGLSVRISFDDRDNIELEITLPEPHAELPELDVPGSDPEHWPPWALAILDAKARGRLGRYERFTIRPDRIVLRDSSAGDESEINPRLDALIDLARTLRPTGEDLPTSLAARFVEEPDPRFRMNILRALEGIAPETSELTGVLEQALGDPEPEIRFAAARAIGDEGLEVVERLLDDVRPSPALKARALSHLVSHVDAERAVACLRVAVTHRPGELRTRGLELLTPALAEPLLPELLQLVSPNSSPEAAVALASALAGLEAPEAHDALIQLLSHYAPDVRVAVANTLAEEGGPAALPALRRASFQDSEVERATAAAIAQIEARSAPVKGRLALTEPEETRGALSAPESEEGSLSLARDDAAPGALSVDRSTREEQAEPETDRASRNLQKIEE